MRQRSGRPRPGGIESGRDFRQRFEPLSSTCAWLIGCRPGSSALLIDPVVNSIDHDLAALQALGLRLALTLDRTLFSASMSQNDAQSPPPALADSLALWLGAGASFFAAAGAAAKVGRASCLA